MRRPPKLPPERLRRLQALAQIKADAELARLAVAAQGRARLSAALTALGAAEPPLSAAGQTGPGHSTASAGGGDGSAAAKAQPVDPALVRARLAHGKWIEMQRSELNARLAMVQADWHRMHPAAARAFGRARVLERLAGQAERARKRPGSSD